MTMSTYKSLGGPAGGVVVTNDAELAQRLDAIAFPGLTANFDAAKAAALAVTMIDWKVAGPAYAAAMVATAAPAGHRTGRPRGCRCSPAPTGRPARTSSRCARTAGVAASTRPAGCAGPTCWPAGSGCRSSRSRAT